MKERSKQRLCKAVNQTKRKAAVIVIELKYFMKLLKIEKYLKQSRKLKFLIWSKTKHQPYRGFWD